MFLILSKIPKLKKNANKIIAEITSLNSKYAKTK